jgi:hypothetical protein
MGGELWRNGIIDLWALYQVIKQDLQKNKMNMLLAAIENNKCLLLYCILKATKEKQFIRMTLLIRELPLFDA